MLQPVVRRTWAPEGETPIHYSWDRRERLSVISAISVSAKRRRLGLYFYIHDHNIVTDDFERFVATLAQLIKKELSRMLPEEGTVPRNVHPMTYVGSLYHTMLDLRRSYHSVTVSLDVLRFVADYLERAILFLEGA